MGRLTANDIARLSLLPEELKLKGMVAAERAVVDGELEGPTRGGEVILKSHAHVVGDVHQPACGHRKPSHFDGRSVQVRENGQASERLERKSVRQIAKKQKSLSSRIQRADPVEAD